MPVRRLRTRSLKTIFLFGRRVCSKACRRCITRLSDADSRVFSAPQMCFEDVVSRVELRQRVAKTAKPGNHHRPEVDVCDIWVLMTPSSDIPYGMFALVATLPLPTPFYVSDSHPRS